MAIPTSVNDQITDSVTGQAPSPAPALRDTVMVETLGMAMHNAVTQQQNSSMIASAAMTAACTRMLAVPLPQPPATSETQTDRASSTPAPKS